MVILSKSSELPLRGIGWKSPRLVFPLAAATLLVAAVLWHQLPASTPSAQTRDSTRQQAIPVQMAIAARADVPVYLEGLGTVQAYYTVTITPRVDGQLQKVTFTEGQSVKQGDVLAQIDPRPFQAALDQAMAVRARDVAQLAGAKSDLDRSKALAPRILATKQTIDQQTALVGQLEAQIKADQAAIDNARTQLSYATIVAPIDGVTGIRLVDPGNMVHATQTNGIVVLTQVQPITCIFTLPEQTFPEVQRALRAGPVPVVALSRSPNDASGTGADTELDRGTVELINNQINQASGTIQVKAVFPNTNEALWPGEFVNARVLLQTVHGALTIPTAAIQRGPQGVFAYVVRADSTVEARTLQIGQHTRGRTIVMKGLHEGERVVTSDQYQLQPGALVQSTAGTLASAAQ
jgi:membrane fusion protein, multidrug efflux system